MPVAADCLFILDLNRDLPRQTEGSCQALQSDLGKSDYRGLAMKAHITSGSQQFRAHAQNL